MAGGLYDGYAAFELLALDQTFSFSHTLLAGLVVLRSDQDYRLLEFEDILEYRG